MGDYLAVVESNTTGVQNRCQNIRHVHAVSSVVSDVLDEIGAPVFFEGPVLGERELCDGAPHGVLLADPIIWAEGPYRYCEYVLRGVARAAGLVDLPMGYRDIDKM